MDYFSSDWHIGHRNILTLSKRPFESMEEMRDQILQNMTSIMKKGDTLYFLGDLAFSQADAEYVLELFQGETDCLRLGSGESRFELQPQEASGEVPEDCGHPGVQEQGRRESGFIYPTSPSGSGVPASHNSFHLYGHVHMFSPELAFLEDQPYGKSLNVNLEFNNYGPYSLEDIVTIMEGKPDNTDYSIMQDFQNKK